MSDIFKQFKLLFNNTPERKVISKNIAWLFSEKVVRFILGFFVGVLVTRYLGTERYGVFSYVLAITGIVGTLSGLGLESIVTRELVKQPNKSDVLLGTSFWLTLIAGLIAQLLCLLIIYMVRPEDHLSLILVAIISFSFLLKPFYVIVQYFESKVQSRLIVPVTITILIISSCLKLFFIYYKWSLKAFVWTLLIESFLLAIGLLMVYWNQVGSFLKWTFDRKLGKQLLKDSLPLMFSSLMIIIYMKIDQIMIREMISETEVGLYSAAVRLAELWYFIPIILTQSFFPKMIQSKEESPPLFYNQLQRLYNLVTLIAYGIAIPVCIFATPIVIFIYGEPFAPSGLMLSLLIWTSLPVALGTVRSTFILSMNWTKIYLIITICSTILNILLNWYLIPIYGGLGAVVATLISYSFAAIFSCFIYRPLWRNGRMMLKALVWPKII